MEPLNEYESGHWLESAYCFGASIKKLGLEVSLLTTSSSWSRPLLEDLSTAYGVDFPIFDDLPPSPEVFVLWRNRVGILSGSDSLRSALKKPAILFSAVLLASAQVAFSLSHYCFSYFSALRKFKGIDLLVIPTGDNFLVSVAIDIAARINGITSRKFRLVGSQGQGVAAFSKSTYFKRRGRDIAYENPELVGYSSGQHVVLYPPIRIPEAEQLAALSTKEYDWAFLGKPRKSKVALSNLVFQDLARRQLKGIAQENEWTSKLFDWEHTLKLPEWVSITTLHASIAKSRVLILPYSQTVYASASSSFVPLAINYSTWIVAPASTGLGRQVQDMGIGLTYQSSEEIPELVEHLAKSPFFAPGKASDDSRLESLKLWLGINEVGGT